jgi:hypothetical protein
MKQGGLVGRKKKEFSFPRNLHYGMFEGIINIAKTKTLPWV